MKYKIVYQLGFIYLKYICSIEKNKINKYNKFEKKSSSSAATIN